MTQVLITIAQARNAVLGAARGLPGEAVAVQDALDRVLSREVVAAGDVPPFPCSAMDGYAIIAGPAGRTLAVVDEARAGRPAGRPLADGEAIRISTGAAVPDGATAVIRQEDVEVGPDRAGQITLTATTAPGEHVRDAGEDQRRGAVVLEAGTRLGAAELGAAVAAGAGTVEVARRPRVAVLSTGDELRAPGEPLGPGEIHNSNAPMLSALAERCGARTEAALRLRDDRAETEAALAEALQAADVVVISGGVSVGPHDHVKPALASLGVEERFWGVALQPGKPTWFGVRDGTLVFGLPGNPVSAVVTFILFAAPALAALQGARRSEPTGEATLAVSVKRNSSREQALRVRQESRDGTVLVTPNGPQGSHMVSSLLGADALALIPAGEGSVPAGARVSIVPLIN